MMFPDDPGTKRLETIIRLAEWGLYAFIGLLAVALIAVIVGIVWAVLR